MLLAKPSVFIAVLLLNVVGSGHVIQAPEQRQAPGHVRGANAGGDVRSVALDVPPALRPYVKSLTSDTLGGASPRVTFTRHDRDVVRLTLQFDLPRQVAQDDWRLTVEPALEPTRRWTPLVTPTDDHVIDQHCFRAPALIATSGRQVLVLVPDLDILQLGTPVRWYLDLDAPRNRLTLGMGLSAVKDRLLFVRRPGAVYPKGRIEVGCYLITSSNPADLRNPWRRPLSFLWTRWGKALFEAGQPLGPDLEPYVKRAYDWAFDTWKARVWQEFDLDGRRVGAPVFIVNETQSPNYRGEVNEREFRSVWNHVWFSSLRSASGLYRHGRRTNRRDLIDKARLAKELALAAPVRNGFFKTVIATEREQIEIGGTRYNRSKGWQTAFWGNSDRNPINRPAGQPRIADVRIAPYHVADMSWTALMMLWWFEELEPDPRLLERATGYADSLLGLQDRTGFFPAWLDTRTLQPLGVLDQSAETSVSAMFLLELARVARQPRYRKAALHAVDAVSREIVPQSRWEDFETYWASSRFEGERLGSRVPRNGTYKVCNLSMFWTADALFEAYQATGRAEYLRLGRRVLDEMLMTQASWQPPYMYVNVLGGFGVRNSDGDWNDARASLLAETILKYGRELRNEEYTQRGLAALRASFVMMYCPENPRTKQQWEKKFPFFGPEDYGFTSENYAHLGTADPEGGGMGVFTIYDWSNGAAAEAYNRLIDRYGLAFVTRQR